MTSTSNEEARTLTFFRNAFAIFGLVIIPVLILIQTFVLESPRGMEIPMLVISAVAGVIVLGSAGIMEYLRRCCLREEDKPETSKETEHDGFSVIEIIGMISILAAFSITLIWFGTNFEKSVLAEQLSSDAEVFDISSARPAGTLIEEMRHSVSRTALVDPIDADGKRRIVCVENTAGELELFVLRKKSGGSEINRVEMNDVLRTSAESFCDAAFVRAYAAPESSK
jgi:hypothetical protein